MKRRVLVLHNAYRQRGGEDAVVEAEVGLLRGRGHEVATYLRSNDEIPGMAPTSVAAQTLWSRRTVRELAQLMDRFRPDVVHVHNSFALISPSACWAAARRGVPVVQTLHNFRLLCPQAMFLRDGRVCEDCLGRWPWRGVLRRCYRDSAARSALLAGMLAMHRALGTFHKAVTRYIALGEFCRAKFIAGGLPAERIAVKPNFVEMDASPPGVRRGGLFVGRLSPEKGVEVLARALAVGATEPLPVIGDGPLASRLGTFGTLTLLGEKPRAEVVERMRHAAYLVVPSVCQESFGRVVIEAFACGLPVVASRIGSLAELIEDGRTGLLFEASCANDLAAKLAWAQSHPQAMRRMGENARAEYEARYTPDRNYARLMAIYAEAVAAVRGRP